MTPHYDGMAVQTANRVGCKPNIKKRGNIMTDDEIAKRHGFMPNMKDTYGIVVETNLCDHLFPYMVKLFRNDYVVISAEGCQNVQQMLAAVYHLLTQMQFDDTILYCGGEVGEDFGEEEDL